MSETLGIQALTSLTTHKQTLSQSKHIHCLTHLSNFYLGDLGSFQGSIKYQKISLTHYPTYNGERT